MKPWRVAPAAPAQAAEVLALLAQGLPALAEGVQARLRCWVAMPDGEPDSVPDSVPGGLPDCVLGAAALLPVAERGGVWGFRAHVQVRSERRRQGIGRALAAALAQEAARWGVPRLITWDTLADAPTNPARAFVQALGAQVAYSLHHFLPHKDTALPRCERLVAALHRHGHVPAGFALLPLHAVPREPVLELHCREFHAQRPAAGQLFDERLADPVLGGLSFALWDGRQLAGYLLAGEAAGLPQVDFWATPAAHRSGWAAALLLHAFVARVVASGGAQARFHCNERAAAPMNFARRIGAPLERVTQGWALAVAPQAEAQAVAVAVAVAVAGSPQTREVVISLPGVTLAEVRQLCLAQPARPVPHLTRLLHAGQVGIDPAPPWPEAWRDGRAARVIGWPGAQAPTTALPPASAWVADEFDAPELQAADFWALDPATVLPPAAAALARLARMSAAEVTDDQRHAILGALPATAQARLREPTAALLARWVSRHNLGVHWAAQPDLGLLAVRLDGLGWWRAQADLDAPQAATALAGWLGLLDLMLGRYLQLQADSGATLRLALDPPAVG